MWTLWLLFVQDLPLPTRYIRSSRQLIRTEIGGRTRHTPIGCVVWVIRIGWIPVCEQARVRLGDISATIADGHAGVVYESNIGTMSKWIIVSCIVRDAVEPNSDASIPVDKDIV